MKRFEIEGTILIPVTLEILANDEEEALNFAIDELNNEYKLDYSGMSHIPNEVEFRLDAFED